LHSIKLKSSWAYEACPINSKSNESYIAIQQDGGVSCFLAKNANNTMTDINLVSRVDNVFLDLASLYSFTQTNFIRVVKFILSGKTNEETHLSDLSLNLMDDLSLIDNLKIYICNRTLRNKETRDDQTERILLTLINNIGNRHATKDKIMNIYLEGKSKTEISNPTVLADIDEMIRIVNDSEKYSPILKRAKEEVNKFKTIEHVYEFLHTNHYIHNELIQKIIDIRESVMPALENPDIQKSARDGNKSSLIGAYLGMLGIGRTSSSKHYFYDITIEDIGEYELDVLDSELSNAGSGIEIEVIDHDRNGSVGVSKNGAEYRVADAFDIGERVTIDIESAVIA
jgi:hypothetical protein